MSFLLTLVCRELLGLVIVDGRIDHGSDKEDHDDQVISWLLACWFVFNGRNVIYYNINKGRFLSNVVTAGEETDFLYKDKHTLILVYDKWLLIPCLVSYNQ